MSNLRDRLRRIQEQKSPEQAQIKINIEHRTDNKENRTNNIEELNKNIAQKAVNDEQNPPNLIKHSWVNCGYRVFKREVIIKSPFVITNPDAFDTYLKEAVCILIPDLNGKDIPSLEDFVFFDLETTGLSSGSGTVAFLAAFGQFFSCVLRGKLCYKMRITQYLLLDYPGQNDFLDNALTHFTNKKSVIVSYNGKCFDSQILKSMCIMNRITPPEYSHVDLLHPCRRLWKKIIQDCSQSSVETKIIGLDRSGDISGALAPDIWFDFVKTGNTEMLIKICDHNIADISGLSAIFSAIISIAEDPFNDKYKFDIERIALYWRKYLRKNNEKFKNKNIYAKIEIVGNKLVKSAAEKKYPKAVYVYAYDQLRDKNFKEALEFVNLGLELFEKDSKWHEKLLRRKERLIRIT